MKILVSVSNAEVPKDGKKQSLVSLIVHSPSKIRGTHLILLVVEADSGPVRSRFPISSLWVLSVSEKTSAALVRQKQSLERIERQIDAGALPEEVSEGLVTPRVTAKDLLAEPEPYQPKI